MVTVYAGPACMQCKMTANVLTEAGVEFEYIDVSTNPEAKEYLNSLGYLSVPVVDTGNGTFQGFHPEKLRALASVAA